MSGRVGPQVTPRESHFHPPSSEGEGTQGLPLPQFDRGSSIVLAAGSLGVHRCLFISKTAELPDEKELI